MAIDLAAWLREQGLGALEPALRGAGVELDVVADLDDADLIELGLTLGDRKRLARAIAGLRTQSLSHAARAGIAPTVAAPLERRHLTVMFCDLVGSTALSARMDPEELRELIVRYHAAVVSAILPFGGYVAQLLGDGVLVYFGYPSAQEDDPVQAVRAALATVRAVGALDLPEGCHLPVRIGIATGPVVVGQLAGQGDATEISATGETPNLAARLQGIANPSEVIVSETTRRLLKGHFELSPLGVLSLRGFPEPQAAWRADGESEMTSRFDARRSRAQTDLIARESELSQIMSCWSAARAGQSQTVVLTGEAGIGKSRLVRAVQESPALKPCIVVQWQCVRHRSGSALHPVTRWVEQAAGMRVTDSLAQRGERLLCALERLGLTPQDIGCLLALIGLSHERYPLIEAAAEHLKRVTHEAVVHWLVQLARRAPLLLVLEDAHWIDPSSRGLVGLILSELRGDRLMLLVTARTDSGTSVPAWSGAHEVTLERLDPASRAALVSAQFGGRPVSQEVLAQIVSRTDGIPLFVEELCQSLLEDGTVCETARGYEFARPLSGISIPATLEASLAARLDRLGSSRRVVQVAAVIGREFSLPVLARCLNLPQPLVASSLAYPVAAGLIETQADAVSTEWRFRHALIREAAYASLSRRERVRLHGQVASALSGPGVAGAPAELLAHHLQEAGDAPGALACWRQAGDLAMRRYAPIEAELHYRAALRLVAGALTGVNAAQCELDLQMRLGATLMQTGGAGTFTPVVERARDLAQSLGRPDEYLGALAGVATALSIAGRFREAIAVCAEGPTDWLAGAAPMAKIARQMRIGIARLGLGELCDATREFERALVALGHVPEENRPLLAGADPVVVLQVYSARTLALRGSLSKAVALAAAALTRADALEHPSTQSWALGIAASLALTAGDVGTGTMHAQRALEIAQRFRLQMRIAQASLHLGRARVGTGEVDEGVALMRHGCELWEQTVGIYCGAEYAALAAHSLMVAGHPNAAAEFVAAGERFQRACEERTQAADLMRMRALLSIDSLGPSQVEGLLRSAMSLADAQGAALLQLRAATDLADLLYTQGRAQEARLCLMPAMERLAEPETFQDVRRARDLLTMLGA